MQIKMEHTRLILASSGFVLALVLLLGFSGSQQAVGMQVPTREQMGYTGVMDVLSETVYLPLVLRECKTELLIYDDFSDPTSGWSNRETATARFAYENGIYVLEDKAYPWGIGSSPDWMLPNDIVIKVDGWADNVDSGFFGLVFALSYWGDYNWKEGYTFLIKPEDQYYSLWKWDFEIDDSESLAWGYSTAVIQDGTAHQTLEVHRTGSAMTLIANSTVITTVNDTDNPLTGTGSVGLFSRSWEAYFDDFEVSSIDCTGSSSDMWLPSGKMSVFTVDDEQRGRNGTATIGKR